MKLELSGNGLLDEIRDYLSTVRLVNRRDRNVNQIGFSFWERLLEHDRSPGYQDNAFIVFLMFTALT